MRKNNKRFSNLILGLMIIFIASCTKDNPSTLDCNGVENGMSMLDDCGDCHQSYVYDFLSHIPTYINDTTGLVLGATEILVLAGSVEDIAQNPNWNAGCDSIQIRPQL